MISVDNRDGVVLASLSGEIDLEKSPAVKAELLRQVSQRQPVAVDLSQVLYIDSSGIASLIEALQQARRQGTDFVLIGLSQSAKRVIKLTRLDTVFRSFDTLDAYLAQR